MGHSSNNDFKCLQVGTNGVISFQEGFSHHLPNPFPSELTFISSAFLLAPFWSDIDPSIYGSIRYQIHDQFNSAFLSQVNDFISNYTESTFTGTWMLVVQWYEVVEARTTAPVSLLYQPIAVNKIQSPINSVVICVIVEWTKYCLQLTAG